MKRATFKVCLLPLFGWLVACPSEPPPPPDTVDLRPAEPTPEVRELTPSQVEVASQEYRIRVDGLRVERPGPDRPWELVVDLRLAWSRAPEFNGMSTGARGVSVQRTRIVLLSDGDRIPVRPMHDDLPAGGGETLVIAALGDRQTETTLRFPLPAGVPTDAVVVVPSETGTVWLRLLGSPRTVKGDPAVEVDVVDVAGRPIRADGSVTLDGTELPRPELYQPWRLPPGAEARFELDGYQPTTVVLSEAPFQEVRILSEGLVGLQEARFAEGWPTSTLPADPKTLLEVSHLVRGQEEAVAWVRDTLGVLPANGIARSADAVIRRGAGTPEERSMVLIELLKRQGIHARLACGDLTADQAAALLDADVPLPRLDGRFADLVAEGRRRVEALEPGLAAAIEAHPDGAMSAREAAPLVPEWCWVETEVGEDQPWVAIDLRPPPFDAEPLPFLWRTTTQLMRDAWRVSVELVAAVRRPGGVDSVLLADNGGTVAAFRGRAFVIDLYPAGRRLQAMFSTAHEFEVDGHLGESIAIADVETVLLVVRFDDPDGLVSGEHRIELWQANDQGVPPGPLRVVVTVPSGERTPERVTRHLRGAVQGAHPDPGVSATLARHALHDLLVAHLAPDELPGQPQMLLSVSSVTADGQMGTRMETVPPSMPLSVGEDLPTAQQRARLAAADAVARSLVLERSDPPAPTGWLTASEQLGELAGVPGTTQIAVARALPIVDVAQDGQGTLWSFDPRTGGLGWWMHAPEVFTDVRGDDARSLRGEPMWPHRYWDLPTRCLELARWAPVEDAPEACRTGAVTP